MPIKVNPRFNACLDNIFTNISIASNAIDTFDTYFSDHISITFYFDVETLKPLNKRRNYRPITDEGLFKLYNRIETVNWGFLSEIDLSLDTKFESFLNILLKSVYECLPIKCKLVSEGCSTKIKWFHHELAEMRERLKFLIKINRDS